MAKCKGSNLFCPLLTWIAPFWTTTPNLNHQIAKCEDFSHRTQHSPRSEHLPHQIHTQQFITLCGAKVLGGGGGGAGIGVLGKSYASVLSFITREAPCCLEHGQRPKKL